MTTPLLRDLVARLGPVRDIARHEAGAPRLVVLRAAGDPDCVAVIGASRALARCGISLHAAKGAVEAMLESGDAALTLPLVASEEDLGRELRAAGVACRTAGPGHAGHQGGILTV